MISNIVRSHGLMFVVVAMLLSPNISLSQESDVDLDTGIKKSSLSALKEGHKVMRDGDLYGAIILYKKALALDRNNRAAEYSLESAVNELTLEMWKSDLSDECQSWALSTMLGCANNYFSFDGAPLHPTIIEELVGLVSDPSGDYVVSINIIDSQGSNRFCCDSDVSVYDEAIRYKEDVEGNMFIYKHIGMTDNGVHVIYASAHGASVAGVSTYILLANFKLDYGLDIDSIDQARVSMSKPRLLINKLGSMSLGDRWQGEIKVSGNKLFIGKDVGWFSGRKYGGAYSENPKDREILIQIP